MTPHKHPAFPTLDRKFIPFPSRRSVVHSTSGIVACTQTLAAQAGIEILAKGGNAADAAVAVAAALNVTEPSSTGVGGDLFVLYYSAKDKKVRGLNASGRTPNGCSLDRVRNALGLKDGDFGTVSMYSPLAVTVPGSAAGLIDTLTKFGNKKVSTEEIFRPAIDLAEQGFPVSELASTFWHASERQIRAASSNFREILKDDTNAKSGVRAPNPGEIMKNPALANTFRLLAQHGKKGFYEGKVAKEIVKVVQDRGKEAGIHAADLLSLKDLKIHGERGSQEVDPISLVFHGQGVSASSSDPDKKDNTGLEVWECAPNGQGIVALMTLGILEELEKGGKIPKFTEKDHNSSKYLHALIESLHIAFADATWFVTDPDVVQVPTQGLLSREYLKERAKLFDAEKINDDLPHGSPAFNSCDTVYFSVTDGEGNGCSFISSLYGGFGSGIVPQGCGFPLQNRGANFTLVRGHPNAMAANKRPYHTIIPAIVTNPTDQSLHSIFGVMGGFMQPQGQVQVLMNQTVFGMNPQVALDAPRVCIGAGTPEQGKVLDRTVYVEQGISDQVVEELKALKHKVEVVQDWDRGMFGRGQVIRCKVEDGQRIYSAGSDPRGDGAALPAHVRQLRRSQQTFIQRLLRWATGSAE
ncbi:MAG: hypothetical protein M1814_005287 [Vezdaea aestivalis]|nr:MAG: hypothetical protein M1814_005287 [Vezdaea aestivalis]